MKSLSLFAFVLSLALCAQTPSPGGDPAFRAVILAPNPGALAHRLSDLGYDIAHDQPPGGVKLVVSLAEERALQAAGLFPMRVERAEPLRTKLGRTEVLPGYRDLAAIHAELQALASANPGLVSYHDAASRWGPGGTVEGRPIPIIKISDSVALDEDEPEVLFVSGHHCREIVTPEVALEIAAGLVNGYASDPRIRAIVDGNEIWIAPIWNPDGLEHVWNVNNLWRKNRRDLGGGVFGVDLNRNYALGWDASCGGSTNPSSQTYRGTAPESEPETQTMVALSRDRRFAKVMDFHSHGREVLLGYTCSSMPTAIDDLIVAEGTDLAAAVADPPGYTTRRPSAEGEHQQWQMREHTSYAFLTETQTQFQPSHADALAEAQAVWPSALAFLERAVPLSGLVSNANNGAPVEARITVAGLNWSNGESRHSEPRYGRYHLWLPDGQWDVTANAAGFDPVTHTVTVVAGQTTVRDFALQPAFELELATSGGGVGDLTVTLNRIPSSTVEGYTIFSLTPATPTGSGALFGLILDELSLVSLQTPASAGNPLHWRYPAGPGVFPSQPYQLGPGAVPLPPAAVMEGVALAITAGYSSWRISEVATVSF